MNRYQASTSERKLRGAFYTPPELVRAMLEKIQPGPADVLLDPSCGDGEFLVGAVAHAVRGGGRPPALVGMDVDPAAAAAARERVESALRRSFPGQRALLLGASALDLPDRAALAQAVPALGQPARLLVVGNPPYVEAKRLSSTAKVDLRQRFPGAAGGAPDLYLYFLHVCLGWLAGSDRLAFVLPNKTLVSVNAQPLREQLLAERRLQGIDFASQAGLFEGAAVYPVVLYAAAPRPQPAAVRLERLDRGPEGLAPTPLPSLPAELYSATGTRAFFPSPEEPVLAGALESLLRGLPGGRLGDVLDIRWTVSFHRAGLRERFVTRDRPASPNGRPLLGGGAFSGNGEVRRFRIDWAGWWIDYDEARLKAEGNSLPRPALFEGPKVVICQNGRTLRAAWDESGQVLKDTFLCGLPRPVDHPLSRCPRALPGLLCSRAAHFFYSHVFHGGHVGGGYLHFLRSFLADLPLGSWSDAAAEEVADLVRRREVVPPGAAAETLEEAIEARVSETLGLGPQVSEALARWAAADPNWRDRERVRAPR